MKSNRKSGLWDKYSKTQNWRLFLLAIFTLILTCEPLVYTFDETEKAQSYVASSLINPSVPDSVLKIMTWNIRFGAGRVSWFGDGCGNRVILTADEVKSHLRLIADKISEQNTDVVLIQEVDIESKRSAYIDQVQWLLDNTELNYGVFASAWHAQYIPSDGLGRMNMGTAILSRWPLENATRIALPLRKDQDALTQYFYLRRNMLKARLNYPGLDNLYLVNVHTAAFSTDDTKLKHIEKFYEELLKLESDGMSIIAGGDLNTLPPGSDSTDFCMEDMCPGESFHNMGDDPFHKEGSNYSAEQTWLLKYYVNFQTAIPLQDYQAAQSDYFTHTTIHPDGTWDRKLDYIFTNGSFVTGSGATHQEASACSDHTPVSVLWRIPQ